MNESQHNEFIELVKIHHELAALHGRMYDLSNARQKQHRPATELMDAQFAITDAALAVTAAMRMISGQ